MGFLGCRVRRVCCALLGIVGIVCVSVTLVVNFYAPFAAVPPIVARQGTPVWEESWDSFDVATWDSASWLGGWNGEFHFYTGPPSNRSRNLIVENGTLYLQPDLTANFRPDGGERLGWQGTLGCGRTSPKDAGSHQCPKPSDTPSVALDGAKAGAFPQCAVPFDPSKCNVTAGVCKPDGSGMRGAGCKYSTIPPVTSATFRSRRTFKFGRLEIRARLPRGDWLWPAIWMLPQDSVYGGWPASGEIDLMESRGNTGSSSCGPWQDSSGFGSTLHFGPDAAHNAYSHTHTETHVDGSLSDDFHTFGLMWSERGLYTYLDDDKDVVLAVDFAQRSFWDRGQTPETVCWARKNGQCTFWMPLWIGSNWTGTDTWAKKGTRAAPFDQEFFLQINLAVGGTGGYFPDYCLRKPWRNGDSEPGSDFLADFERWWPTWGGDVEHPEKGAARSSAMAIDWIRYWPDEHHAEPSKLVQF